MTLTLRQELNVAVVGCGWASNALHIPAWKKVPGVKITAVCDSSAQKAQETAKRWGIPSSYSNLSDVLKSNNGVCVVDICTPVTTHFQLVTEAIHASCHVLVEKPFVSTLKEADQIAAQLEDRPGLKLCVDHNWLFDPNMLRLRSYVKKGLLGDIVSVEIEGFHGSDEPAAKDRDNYLHKMPGGRMGETIPHHIYVILDFLSAPLTVESVVAKKQGSYSWMPNDELEVILSSGQKLGRSRLSFNASVGQTIKVYGTKASYMLMGTHTLIKLPVMPTGGFGGLPFAWNMVSRLFSSWGYCAGKALLGQWSQNTEVLIRLFADSVMNNSQPPVTFKEARETERIFEEVVSRLPAT